MTTATEPRKLLCQIQPLPEAPPLCKDGTRYGDMDDNQETLAKAVDECAGRYVTNYGEIAQWWDTSGAPARADLYPAAAGYLARIMAGEGSYGVAKRWAHTWAQKRSLDQKALRFCLWNVRDKGPDGHDEELASPQAIEEAERAMQVIAVKAAETRLF